jgi:hypothetical protein
VPDFALTIHFIHILIVFFYTHSIPRNLLWWTLQAASAALMTFVGIWVCQRRELQPIVFGALLGGGIGSSSNSAETRTGENADSSSHPENTQGDEDLESGLASFSRGRGRGRNRDEFEMMPVRETAETKT